LFCLEGLEPGLALLEGLGGVAAALELEVEVEGEEGAGGGFDRPEGAQDVGNALGEDDAAKADIFRGDRGGADDRGFAGD
jgi:hypothetical protein